MVQYVQTSHNFSYNQFLWSKIHANAYTSAQNTTTAPRWEGARWEHRDGKEKAQMESIHRRSNVDGWDIEWPRCERHNNSLCRITISKLVNWLGKEQKRLTPIQNLATVDPLTSVGSIKKTTHLGLHQRRWTNKRSCHTPPYNDTQPAHDSNGLSYPAKKQSKKNPEFSESWW